MVRGTGRPSCPSHPIDHSIQFSSPRSDAQGILMRANTILEMRGIVKRFPGVSALDHVSFELRKGEIHALVGENGAGKSTLVKVLGGIYPKDEGEMLFDGKRVDIRNPHQARDLGLSFVHQELNLVPFFSALENVALGLEYPRNRFGLIDWGNLLRQVSEVATQVGVQFDLRKWVNELSVAQRWMVAFIRSLLFQARVLVIDELTSSLASNEVNILFQIIRNLRQKGVSIIYISHRLEEIFQLADRVTVMKDAKKVETLPVRDIDMSKLISLMVGKEVNHRFPKEEIPMGESILLSVRDITGGIVKDVSFDLHESEILGIAGLVGSGRSELARLIFGIDRKESGEIYLNGEKVKVDSSREAVKRGFALVPEERREQGLVTNMSVKENITMTSLPRYLHTWWLPLISANKEKGTIRELIKSFSIQTPSITQKVAYLSGGNQQKIVLAKWLASGAKIFILDEPTRGIDVGSKVEIYRLVQVLAKQGAGIILISSELEEIVNICDRILVMHNGMVAKEIIAKESTVKDVLSYCQGQSASEKKRHRQGQVSS
jgi:ABC-type sugar transport system ATPase subunit